LKFNKKGDPSSIETLHIASVCIQKSCSKAVAAKRNNEVHLQERRMVKSQLVTD
jgi:hypothetical protein